MRAISLKISNSSLERAEEIARSLGMSRAAYIRLAIDRCNEESAAQIRAEALAAASRKVRDESMRINAEFAAIEVDPGD